MPSRSAGAGRDVVLGIARERRWWVSGRRIGSIRRAAAFIDDVGFALLFPSDRVLVPSLWEAVAGGETEPFATGMNSNEQRVWAWKDELPLRGLAWYGNFVGGRGSFLSPRLLRLLYPASGDIDDHLEVDLSPTAHELAATLVDGPMSSATLRAFLGDRHRYQRAAVELQRHLLVTNAGVHQQASGWPSVLLDLTCRRFDVGTEQNPLAAAELFIGVVLDTSVGDLARAFRWPVAKARGHLDALVDSGRAVSDEHRYLAPSVRRHWDVSVEK